jgi:hypothetical protein
MTRIIYCKATIEEPAVFREPLLLNDEGGADREEACRRFTGNGEPGQTIELVEITDKRK